MKLWLCLDHSGRRGCCGFAEIRCEGGRFSYQRYTVLGRLFQKHLTPEQTEKLTEVIVEAINKFNAAEAEKENEK